jgi:pimeloyl-ACP methyl ester carboxylesterase
MDVPDVRYARAGGVAVAYQVVGDGPQTLVFSPQVSDLLTIWLIEESREFLERLKETMRVVVFNPRGTGLSDRPRNVTLEARMDDISSILDDLGVARASLLGLSTSANACALYAATHPDRVERLILAHPYPRAIPSEDYPWGFDEDGWLEWIRENREHWGERAFMERVAANLVPALAEEPEQLDLFVWQARLAASPTAAAEWVRLAMETDIVDILGSIRVPTLVLHRSEEGPTTTYGLGPARYVADRIPRSHALALRSRGASLYSAEAADAVLEFLRGEDPLVVPESVLATCSSPTSSARPSARLPSAIVRGGTS